MNIFATAFVGFAIAVIVIQTLRARKMGPRVGWIPTRLRPRLNAFYRRRGWPSPHGDSGERLDWWRPVDGSTTARDDAVVRITRYAMNVVVWIGVVVVAVWFIRTH
ncbi:MAG: hypothetical protein QOG30_1529 [Acidimicrobiaceae bacterium]|jgi:hypothetical protein